MFFVFITHFVNIGWARKRGVAFANYAIIEKVARMKLFPRTNFQFVMKFLILSFLILALSGMVIWYEGTGTNSDVVLAIDASASMLADDYEPSRLDAAKETAIDLVSSLDLGTKIGVITFAGVSFVTQVLTQDKIDIIERIRSINVITTGGTAIGEAILLGTNLLSLQEESQGKMLVLISDGQNTVGINVDDAIHYANEEGVIIQTIGIGTERGGSFASASAVSQLDKVTLMHIAESTNGRFYHTQTKEELRGTLFDIFNTEKKKVGIETQPHLLLIAIFLFFIEWILANTRYRITP